MFYTSLGRLLMVDLGEDEDKFEAFMMPLTQSFQSLGQVLVNQTSGYPSDEGRGFAFVQRLLRSTKQRNYKQSWF